MRQTYGREASQPPSASLPHPAPYALPATGGRAYFHARSSSVASALRARPRASILVTMPNLMFCNIFPQFTQRKICILPQNVLTCTLLHELYEQFILQTHGWEKDEKRIGQAHEAASVIESQYMNMSISPRRVFESSCGSYKIEDIYQLEIPYNVDGIFLDIYPLTEIIKIKNGAIIKR